jgi:hypothetical protein
MFVALSAQQYSVVQAEPRRVLNVPQPSDSTSSTGQGKVLLRARWGTAPGEFGTTREGSRPGPMDFAVVGESLYVLDTVNARIQVFGLDGTLKTIIPIATKTADFLCVGPDGNVAVLDAFCKRQLKEFSPAGELRRSMKVPETLGLPSAVFMDGQRVWLEERHDRVFEVSAAESRKDAPARVVNVLPGRPVLSRRGTLHAAKSGERDVVIRVSAANKAEEELAVRFPSRLVSVVTLEADGSDHVCIAGVCESREGTGKAGAKIVATSVTPSGTVAGAVAMPDAYVTDHYRKLWLLKSGELVQMQTSHEEVQFVLWTLQPAEGEVLK